MLLINYEPFVVDVDGRFNDTFVNLWEARLFGHWAHKYNLYYEAHRIQDSISFCLWLWGPWEKSLSVCAAPLFLLRSMEKKTTIFFKDFSFFFLKLIFQFLSSEKYWELLQWPITLNLKGKRRILLCWTIPSFSIPSTFCNTVG